MGVEQYSLVENDWTNLGAIINDLTQRVVGQEVHPTSSPTFTSLTLSGLSDTHVVYSKAGVLTGDSNFRWDDSAKELLIGDSSILRDGGTYAEFRAVSGSNMRLTLATGDGTKHLGINFGDTPVSSYAFFISDAGNSDLQLRGANALDSSDPSEYGELIMNSSGFALRTLKGKIVVTPFSGETTFNTSVLDVVGVDTELTLHNTTQEDIDEGQNSKLIFKGKDSIGNTRETGQIEVRHDGTSTNGASEMVLSTMNSSNISVERVKIDSGGIFSINSTDTSNQVQISHDNLHGYIKWNDGDLIFETDEGTNTNTTVRIRGKGTGFGEIEVYDQDNAEHFRLLCTAGRAIIEAAGISPGPLSFNENANSDVQMFRFAGEGETPRINVYGFRSGDILRNLQISCGRDAPDTASFNNMSNYWFNGTIKSTAGAQLGDGGVTNYVDIESDGDIVQKGTGRFIESSKFKLTAIGGFAIRLTNTTGAATVQGQTVKADPATDDAVILTAADDSECIGVFLDAGIADDAEAWVVVAGIADVAMGDNEAATRGNWVETNSAEAGYADATSASPAAAPQHFNEIGHCIESVAAGGGGTHILARCVLHFN